MKKLWFKSLLAGLVLSMGLASCFDEKMNDAEKEGQVEVAGEGEDFISFSFDMESSVGARAVERENTQKERAVNTVRVILYDRGETQTVSTGNEEALYVFDLVATNYNGAETFTGADVVKSASTNTVLVSLAKKVKLQNYFAVALINAPLEVLNLTLPGKKLSDLKEDIASTGTLGISYLIGSGEIICLYLILKVNFLYTEIIICLKPQRKLKKSCKYCG